MIYDLKGKVALVTGAASKLGVGCAVAQRVAQDGADVAVVDLHRGADPRSGETGIDDWKGLDGVVEEIVALGQQGLALAADVTRSDQVIKMVDTVLAEFGKIDILVNNAAITGPFRVNTVDVDEKAWKLVLAVNLVAPFLCSQIVAKSMIEKRVRGRIINIASRAGKIGAPRLAAYAASKAGLINLTQTLALELASKKINVKVVCPGTVATEMQVDRPIVNQSKKLNIGIGEAVTRVYSDLIATIPLGKVAMGSDIANAVAFLASEQSAHITGIALNVSGGKLMMP